MPPYSAPVSSPPEASASPPAVVVDSLVKRYGGRAVVDHLSFSAQAGAVTAVLGPNGAGKTTTMECIEGLRRPDGGQVRVHGLDPVRDAAALAPRVGVMLQDGGLPTGARVSEVITHVASLHAHPLDPASLLEALGLAAHARTTVRRLSGGQRQRLALSLAVVGRPEVAIFDEPTAGLDPQARHTVWDLVRRLRDDGVAVLLTTHLMDEAEGLADHVVVIDAGRVVAAGSPTQLLEGGGDRLRFQAAPGLDLRSLQSALPPGIALVEPEPGRYVVEGSPQTPVDPQVIATVTAWCAARGVMPSGLSVGRRSLEDLFLELTGRQLR